MPPTGRDCFVSTTTAMKAIANPRGKSGWLCHVECKYRWDPVIEASVRWTIDWKEHVSNNRQAE